ncbi:winged helix-turn-helix domain-containing protein [Tahibacter soli]|uniref:Winged helix-turn-helix domain-containing protein n=1 Tax=Tahibacter soli TaxID=2983605 RepID=A0A9X4BIH0_9GAMM|nr:winged helix-turn-helix domain-containing protein [Tahibacter soli]MDC8013618.1 winged helix-turn-helix domain-containing protein [Tahibacter soli]
MTSGKTYRFGDFVLRPATREFLRKGAAIAVPVRLFDCLAYLIEHRSRAVGRDELGAAVWGRSDVSEAQLTQTILRARRLLNEGSGDASCIRTIPKFGYHWVCDVAVEIADESPRAPIAPVPVPARDDDAPQTVPRPRRPRWIVAAAACAMALAAAAAWFYVRPLPPPAPAPEATEAAIVVLPLDVAPDGDAAWVRLGAMDVVAERLRAAGLKVPASEDTLALMRASGARPADVLRGSGAAWLVSGRAGRSARGWRVDLKAANAAGFDYAASEEADEVLPALRAATDALMRQLGLKSVPSSDADLALEETVRRAQAAMLANDFPTAQRILTQAPSRVSERPELRYQIAVLAFRAGRLDDAETGWRDLLDDESVARASPLRARAHYGLGAIAMMRDRADDAERSFGAALTLLEGRDNLLEYGKALGGRGGARLTLGRVQEGMDDLARARVVLEQSGDRLALARLNVAYGIASLARDRPREAVPVLADAIADLEPFGAVNERAHAYSAQVNAGLALLDYAQASQANEAARALLPLIGDPLNRAETLLDRATLLLAQGRLDEADPVLAELDALDLAPYAGLDGRRLELRARRAWDRGDVQAVPALATAAVDRLAPVDAETAADMVLLRQRALLALDRRDAAQTALDTLPSALQAPPGGRAPLGLRLAQAELQAARGDLKAAEWEFAAAAAVVDAGDVPAQTLRLTASRVPVLLAQGQRDAASALVGRLPEAADADFDGALVRVRLYHALGRVQPWADALRRARALAGQRTIPAALTVPPVP